MNRQDFYNRLAAISDMTNKSFNDPKVIFEFYDRQVSKHLSYDKACEALEKIMLDPRRFPTVRDILDAGGVPKELDAKDKGNVIAGKIVEAVAKFGSYQENKAFEFIGPEGIEAVRRAGGWSHLCEMMTEDNQTIFQAQLRDSATAIVRSGVVPRPSQESLQEARDTAIDLLKTAEGKGNVVVLGGGKK